MLVWLKTLDSSNLRVTRLAQCTVRAKIKHFIHLSEVSMKIHFVTLSPPVNMVTLTRSSTVVTMTQHPCSLARLCHATGL